MSNIDGPRKVEDSIDDTINCYLYGDDYQKVQSKHKHVVSVPLSAETRFSTLACLFRRKSFRELLSATYFAKFDPSHLIVYTALCRALVSAAPSAQSCVNYQMAGVNFNEVSCTLRGSP